MEESKNITNKNIDRVFNKALKNVEKKYKSKEEIKKKEEAKERSNLHRNMIIILLKGSPQTISELAKELNVSRPTIYLHLKVLEKKGLIERSKDITKKGAPVTITLKEKELSELEQKNLVEFLLWLKEQKEVSSESLDIFFKTQRRYLSNAWVEAGVNGLIGNKVFITSEGEKFLEEHKGKDNPIKV